LVEAQEFLIDKPLISRYQYRRDNVSTVETSDRITRYSAEHLSYIPISALSSVEKYSLCFCRLRLLESVSQRLFSQRRFNDSGGAKRGHFIWVPFSKKLARSTGQM